MPSGDSGCLSSILRWTMVVLIDGRLDTAPPAARSEAIQSDTTSPPLRVINVRKV